MSVSLQKGQKVDLTKGNAGLNRIIVGLGWDEMKQPSKGLLQGLFGAQAPAIDCDATAFLCNEAGKLTAQDDVVYFHNLTHRSGSVRHMGDNLTGQGEGDDEQITVELAKVPAQFHKIVFVVNIYQARERSQHFGMIQNAFIRIVDAASGKELCRYNLSDNYDSLTAMVFGEVYRHQNEWKFSAIGSGTRDNSIGELAKRYM